MAIPFMEMVTVEGGSCLGGWGSSLSCGCTGLKIAIRYSSGDVQLEVYT